MNNDSHRRNPSRRRQTRGRAEIHEDCRERHPVPPTADAAKPVSQSLNNRPGPPATGECTRVRIAEKEKGMPQWRPDPTFSRSPKIAMQAPQEAVAFVALVERPRTGPQRMGGSDTLRDIVDGSRPLSWEVTLTRTLASRLMNGAAGLAPDSWWRMHFMLRVMGFTARYVLGTGKRNLAGRTPNGQEYIANAQQVWLVKSSLAVVNGASSVS